MHQGLAVQVYFIFLPQFKAEPLLITLSTPVEQFPLFISSKGPVRYEYSLK